MTPERYAVIRFGGTPPDVRETLSTVMFRDAEAAWEFARLLDYALVYRLEPVKRQEPYRAQG